MSETVQQVVGRCDPTLTARAVRPWPLVYYAGPDPGLDRPVHVRAGSGLTRIGERLAVIQDDACFIALVDPESRTVQSICLPAGQDNRRQFDDARGNKNWKPDLEACTTIVEDGQELLLALGSGSSPRREQVLALPWPPVRSDVYWQSAPAFYGLLRSWTDFAGSELNIEGAVQPGGGTLRLFQRGNGAPRQGRPAVNATCDISWLMLRDHLRNPSMPLPTPGNIRQYDLGLLDGIRLTFTDAAVRGQSVFFTATAEDSPDAVRDGPVMGSILGRIDADGSARWAMLHDERGERLRGKVEGLCLDSHSAGRGWVLIDRDDPQAASELCEIELSGDWGG